MKIYYFHALKALLESQGEIKMHYGIPLLKSSYQEKGPLNVCGKTKLYFLQFQK